MHPPPLPSGLILPSWWNVRQKAEVATLCTLCLNLPVLSVHCLCPDFTVCGCKQDAENTRKTSWVTHWCHALFELIRRLQVLHYQQLEAAGINSGLQLSSHCSSNRCNSPLQASITKQIMPPPPPCLAGQDANQGQPSRLQPLWCIWWETSLNKFTDETTYTRNSHF